MLMQFDKDKTRNRQLRIVTGEIAWRQQSVSGVWTLLMLVNVLYKRFFLVNKILIKESGWLFYKN